MNVETEINVKGGMGVSPVQYRAGKNGRLWLIVGVALIYSLTAQAQDQKKEEKAEVPRVMSVTPFSVIRGQATVLQIKGMNLSEATAVRIESASGPVVGVIKSKAKIEPNKKGVAPKGGNSQIAVEILVPLDGKADSLSLVVTTPTGETPPKSLMVFAVGSVTEEKEPNGGFREAQEIERGKPVRGTIEDVTDVDVFKFHGKAGERIVAEIVAARRGSALDSLLTLYSEKGNTIAGNDDSEAGADSILKVKLPADGVYYLSLSDAQGTGSAAHCYLLTLRNAESTTRPAFKDAP